MGTCGKSIEDSSLELHNKKNMWKPLLIVEAQVLHSQSLLTFAEDSSSRRGRTEELSDFNAALS